MIYIHTALKAEAQAIIDKYKLTKQRVNNFTIFSNNKIMLIISGIGVKNTILAITELSENFELHTDDSFINIGICAADRRYAIGDLLNIGTCIYKSEEIVFNSSSNLVINCFDNEISTNISGIVDMESFGFCTALKNMKNVYMYKVVSDYFEPESITKDMAKSLIFNKIDKILHEVIDAK